VPGCSSAPASSLTSATGHRHGQALALNGVGWEHALLGDHTHALTHCQQALTLFQETGDRDGEAATWDSIGYARHHLGHHIQAVDCYQRALTLYGPSPIHQPACDHDHSGVPTSAPTHVRLKSS
jgi:tetratricopeptide (TPR) repeat protein